MSANVIKATYVPPIRVRPILDWFRHMKVALNVPAQDFACLTEHYRRDAGIPCKDVGRAVDAELGRLGLLDIGWQPPRRPTRR